VTKEESAKLWAEVRANGLKLDACTLHAFGLIGFLDQPPLGRRYRCSRCGGEVDSQARNWYDLGLKHGRGL